MATGKINELVSDEALAQLDALYQKLGINTQAMIDATAAANKFNNEIGGAKTLTDFTRASQTAIQAMQGVASANVTLVDTQQKVTVATEAAVEAVKSKVLADVDASKVLQQVGGTLDQNIKLLVQQKIELKNVADQQKELSKQYAGSAQSQQALNAKTVELTKQSIELKNAIAQQSLVIKQQVKDNQSAAGSQDQMLARLNQLRKAYNALSEEERNNAQIGGVLLSNIKQLSTETSKINEAQGKYNDSVGKYESAIKSAISQYVPFGRQIIQSVDILNDASKATGGASTEVAGLGTQFAAFTIAEFAIAMAAATYYLSQFRDTGQVVEQFVGGLKNQFSALGKAVTEAFTGNGDKNSTVGGRFAKAFASSFEQGVDVTRQMQDVKNLNEINDQLIAKQQAQADQYRAQAKNVGLSAAERIAYLQKAQILETEVVDQQKSNAQANIDAAIQVSNAVKQIDPAYQELLATGSEGSVRLANDLVKTGKLTEQGYELLMAGYAKETQAVNAATMKLIRQQNDEARIGLKEAKQMNTDELELLKAKLTGQKETAKAILDDDKQSYEARLAALVIYVKRSKEIIEVQREVANAAPKISGIKKQANNEIASNEDAGVDAFNAAERLKIHKQASKDFADLFKKLAEETTIDLEDSQNKQVLAIERAAATEANILNNKFIEGKISEKQYRDDLKLINDKANAEKIQAELDTQNAILGIEQGLKLATGLTGLNIGGVTDRQIQGTKNKITGLETAKLKQKTETNTDTANAGKQDVKDKTTEFDDFAKEALESEKVAVEAINNGYQAQIQLLEQKRQLIDDATKAQLTQVNQSIASEKTKQAEINVINAQAESQKKAIQDQENKIKEKQAKLNKVSAIAQIIEGTAVAVVNALSIPVFGEALAIAIGAIGAAQLAVVASAPLPQYEKGGTVSKTGPIITGEAGTELRIDPSGQMSLTAPYANVSYAKTGTKIISNSELMKIVGKPEPINFIGGQSISTKELENLMKENNELTKQLARQRQYRPTPRLDQSYADNYFR